MVLFTGKGGVGKTPLAAATAAHLARSGRKTLVVSTDAAHSLGDALEAELGGEPVEVDGGLFAAHVDTRALLDGSWSRLQGHLRTLLAGAGGGVEARAQRRAARRPRGPGGPRPLAAHRRLHRRRADGRARPAGAGRLALRRRRPGSG